MNERPCAVSGCVALASWDTGFCTMHSKDRLYRAENDTGRRVKRDKPVPPNFDRWPAEPGVWLPGGRQS